ncbi:MAG: tetratricopeptide repeat protein, partial [Saccharospirillum sp.]
QIGYAHFENNNLFEAKRSLDQALDIDDQAPGAHMGLARVYEVEREIELADHHFRRAIRYDGGTEARFQYAVFLYNQGRYDDSRDEFEEVTEDTFYQRRALSFEYLALSSRRAGRIDEAIAAYERAIVLDRLLEKSYVGLADLQSQQERMQEALRAYQGYVSLVRANRADQSPFTLWLGIRIAHAMNHDDLYSSLTLQLRNRFASSPEFREFQNWKIEQGIS